MYHVYLLQKASMVILFIWLVGCTRFYMIDFTQRGQWCGVYKGVGYSVVLPVAISLCVTSHTVTISKQPLQISWLIAKFYTFIFTT